MHEPMNTCAKMTDAMEIASYTYHSDLDTKVYDRIRGLVANWKARPSRSQRELLREYLGDDVEMRMVLDALRSRYANIANHCHIITGRVNQDLAKITNAINGATRLSYGAWLINVPLYVRVYNESNPKLTRLYDYLEKRPRKLLSSLDKYIRRVAKPGRSTETTLRRLCGELTPSNIGHRMKVSSTSWTRHLELSVSSTNHRERWPICCIFCWSR